MLVGCSSALQDDRLHHPDFRADHLLINSVAHLALPAELAAIAARHPVLRGFGYVEPPDKLRWRGLVLAGPPLSLAGASGACRSLFRRVATFPAAAHARQGAWPGAPAKQGVH